MTKGYSLHIGINKYDSEAYYKKDLILHRLPYCDNDAEAISGIGKRFGFRTAVLLDEMATRNLVLEGMERMATALFEGDMFLLTFSGHGTRVQDRNGDEDDGYDETWCLHDDLLLDDEIFSCLQKFRPGVCVVVIADSCHSGTSIKYTTKRFRPGGRFPEAKTSGVAAASLLLSACQDPQYADAGKKLGYSLFTYNLLRVLRQYDLIADYRDLYRKVYKEMPANSKPNLFLFGPGAEQLVKKRPFKF